MSIDHKKEDLTTELSRRIDLFSERRFFGPATVISLFLLFCLWLLPFSLASIGYQKSANKRIYVWIVVIFIALINTAALIGTAFLLGAYGLYLFEL